DEAALRERRAGEQKLVHRLAVLDTHVADRREAREELLFHAPGVPVEQVEEVLHVGDHLDLRFARRYPERPTEVDVVPPAEPRGVPFHDTAAEPSQPLIPLDERVELVPRAARHDHLARVTRDIEEIVDAAPGPDRRIAVDIVAAGEDVLERQTALAVVKERN